MRRKTQIVLAITFMVTAMVSSFSYIYVSQILRQQVTFARNSAAWIDSQLAYIAVNAAVPELADTRVDTRNPAKVRSAIAYYLGTDIYLNKALESVVNDWPMIQDAAIVDADGKAILHTIPRMIDKTVGINERGILDHRPVVDYRFQRL